MRPFSCKARTSTWYKHVQVGTVLAVPVFSKKKILDKTKMGWFDDGMSDDDDDDDARSTQKEEAGSSNCVDCNNDGGEDPLDAYMRTLEDQSRNTMVNDNICDNGRLDVECDDEATSHWMKNSNAVIGNNIGGTKNDDIESTNHSESQSSFHKASDQYFVSSATKDHREVNIQLQQVKHDDIKYLQFMKCILQINNRNSFEGLKWQKENQVTCKPPQGASSLDPIYDLAELRDILPDEVIGWNAIKNLTQPTLVQSQVLGVALCVRKHQRNCNAVESYIFHFKHYSCISCS